MPTPSGSIAAARPSIRVTMSLRLWSAAWSGWRRAKARSWLVSCAARSAPLSALASGRSSRSSPSVSRRTRSEVGDDDRQQVVEVVRDAAGQLARPPPSSAPGGAGPRRARARAVARWSAASAASRSATRSDRSTLARLSCAGDGSAIAFGNSGHSRDRRHHRHRRGRRLDQPLDAVVGVPQRPDRQEMRRPARHDEGGEHPHHPAEGDIAPPRQEVGDGNGDREIGDADQRVGDDVGPDQRPGPTTGRNRAAPARARRAAAGNSRTSPPPIAPAAAHTPPARQR